MDSALPMFGAAFGGFLLGMLSKGVLSYRAGLSHGRDEGYAQGWEAHQKLSAPIPEPMPFEARASAFYDEDARHGATDAALQQIGMGG